MTFQKGHPFYKGGEKGWFKKGVIPKTCFKKGEQLKEKNSHWKGGKYIKDGYEHIYIPNHPFARQNGYVFEHRLVMEKHLGRYLKSKETIHHINKIKTDNRIENLILFKTNSEHIKFHCWIRYNPNAIISPCFL